MTQTGTAAQLHRCERCHRPLTDQASVARGVGRTCAKRIRQAAVLAQIPTVTGTQVAKATELIELHAATRRQRGRQVFDVISTRGDARYTTTPDTCTCPAGEHGRFCYHRLAVALIAA